MNSGDLRDCLPLLVQVQRANMDGTGTVEDLVTPDKYTSGNRRRILKPGGIALDLTPGNRHLYCRPSHPRYFNSIEGCEMVYQAGAQISVPVT